MYMKLLDVNRLEEEEEQQPQQQLEEEEEQQPQQQLEEEDEQQPPQRLQQQQRQPQPQGLGARSRFRQLKQQPSCRGGLQERRPWRRCFLAVARRGVPIGSRPLSPGPAPC
jgi:hypothetical protein